MDRVRELRQAYVDSGPVGSFGVVEIDHVLKEAQKAIQEDSVVDMLRVYEELKTIEG